MTWHLGNCMMKRPQTRVGRWQAGATNLAPDLAVLRQYPVSPPTSAFAWKCVVITCDMIIWQGRNLLLWPLRSPHVWVDVYPCQPGILTKVWPETKRGGKIKLIGS